MRMQDLSRLPNNLSLFATNPSLSDFEPVPF